METYKENFIKKQLKEFEKLSKDLGVKYIIAIETEIKTHATALYIATVIWHILKSIPSEGRQRVITLLMEYIEEEIAEK